MTDIPWAQKSWNPVTGCTPISAGCDHCYARQMANRLAGRNGYPAAPDQFRPTFHRDRLGKPKEWVKPRRIFVVSMGDLFHPAIDYVQFESIMFVAREAPQHTYMMLTKRSRRALHFLGRFYEKWGNRFGEPLENVWVGVTVESQRYDHRILDLHALKAAKKFVSFEPLLGPVDFLPPWISWIDWVICGTEQINGRPGRRVPVDYIRNIRDQCVGGGKPFFLKQMAVGNKVVEMPELDGRVWDQVPEAV